MSEPADDPFSRLEAAFVEISGLLERLRRQIDVTADPVLVDLLAELRGYPAPATSGAREEYSEIAVPFRLATEGGTLSFYSTTTVFGTPVDITLSELALETFFPADEATFTRINQMKAG